MQANYCDSEDPPKNIILPTCSFLLPEPYSLNVHVENPLLPSYLHSFEGMDRSHRPEKDCEDGFNVLQDVLYLFVKCLKVICLLLRENGNRQVFLSKFIDSRLSQIISTDNREFIYLFTWTSLYTSIGHARISASTYPLCDFPGLRPTSPSFSGYRVFGFCSSRMAK